MRKIDVVLVLLVVGCSTAWWSQQHPPLSSSSVVTATPVPLLTRSGRYQILSPPFYLAGVPIGSDEKAVEAALGQPNKKDLSAEETYIWLYERDGQNLNVTFLDGRVIAEGGTGRWSFNDPLRQRTWFMAEQAEVVSQFGSPKRTDNHTLVYPGQPGELTFHLDPQNHVQQVWVTGEVKPLGPGSASSYESEKPAPAVR